MLSTFDLMFFVSNFSFFLYRVADFIHLLLQHLIALSVLKANTFAKQQSVFSTTFMQQYIENINF